MRETVQQPIGWAKPLLAQLAPITAIATIAIIGLLGLLGGAEAARAGTGQLVSRWMTRAPAIDGQLGAGEWSAATLLDLGNGVTLRIGSDDRTLYLGLLDSGDTEVGGGDAFILYFDDEGGPAPILDDGIWTPSLCHEAPELGEGAIEFMSNGQVRFDEYVQDESCAGQLLTGRLSHDVGLLPQGLFREYALPLDGPIPLRAAPGERFGLYLQLFRDGAEVACLPACGVFDPATFRNLMLAASGCNTGVRSLDSGLPLDWADELSAGMGEGWRASGPGSDPALCDQNDTGGSGLSACVANFEYLTSSAQADLRVPFPAGGQSTATVRFLATLTAGAQLDRLEVAAVLENQTTHPLMTWSGNQAHLVELDLNLLAPPYAGSPPIELLIRHRTSSAGGQTGGYAQVDDLELTCGPLLFADDFESGLSTHWSATQP